jgi:hypothetical protein
LASPGFEPGTVQSAVFSFLHVPLIIFFSGNPAHEYMFLTKTKRQIDKWRNGFTDVQTYEQTKGQMDRQKNRQESNGQTSKETNKQTDEKMDR